MKKTKVVLLLIIPALLFPSCSKSKKMTLESEEKKEVIIAQIQGEDFLSSNTLKPGKKNEVRKVDPANPPKEIDLSGKIESKKLDITSFYPKVNMIKLQHPKSNEGKSFRIRKSSKNPPSFSQGTTRLARGIPWPTFLSATMYKDWILVGNLTGLFCYNKKGEHLYTLLECNAFDKSDLLSEGLDLDVKEIDQLLCGFSVMDDICAFVSTHKGEAVVTLFDLKKGAVVHRKKMPVRNATLLSGKQNTFLGYLYEVRVQKSQPYMCTFTANNDTICRFYNKNIFTDMTGMNSFHRPGDPVIYNYKDRLLVKQQGNDTIYRFKSENEINPAYTFRTGSYRATIQDLIKGKTEGKRSINKVLETDKLLLFSMNGSSSAYFYDKAVQEVYESANISSFDSKVLPLNVERLKSNDNTMYMMYTQDLFRRIAEEDTEKKYTVQEREIAKQWKDKMTDSEVLLMILE